eukprot:14013263-Alexandrium_andersonii.AAC.1
MSASLVGSEMCIRDSRATAQPARAATAAFSAAMVAAAGGCCSCCAAPVSYTHLTLPTICSV